MKCNQCESAYINGVFCHETGCPNTRKRYNEDTDEWEKVYTCHECGMGYTVQGNAELCCSTEEWE